MKKLTQYLTFSFIHIIGQERLSNLSNNIKVKMRPLIDRWTKFTPREKQLLLVIGGVFSFFIVYSVIGSFIDLTNSVYNKYYTLQNYKAGSQILKTEFTDLSQVYANTYSDVSVSRIQGDVSQALSIPTPSVTIQDSLLTIKADNVLFEPVILLLEQLRKSYGIFPNKLKITQSKSGYVTFNATFMVTQ